MPTPRKGESLEDMRARDAEAARKRYKWRKTQRTLDKHGNVVSTVQKRVGLVPAEIPNAVLARVTTLYDAAGEPVSQWRQEKPHASEQMLAMRLAAEAFAEQLPRLGPALEPEVVVDDLLVGYPVGDHHIGMLAWKKETGASYDLEIAERLLTQAFEYFIRTAPPAATALLALMGDFFHYDSLKPMTPLSGNLLDADSRYANMVQVGARVIERVVDMLVRKHRQVHIIVETGNHDMAMVPWLAIFLAALYRSEPRVSVDLSPRHYHYFHMGNVLIGTHHGHGARPEQLPGIMAEDQREAWGASRYCYWWTGHVHSKRVYDYPGCMVESFRVLPPGDAWAVNKGYRSHRSMECITYHRRHGEVGRHMVNPEMLT